MISAFEGFDEGIFINEASTRNIDKVDGLLDVGEGLVVNEVTVVLVEPTVE